MASIGNINIPQVVSTSNNISKEYWNRYEVDLNPKRKGRFGEVFFGLDSVLQRNVAIKRIDNIEMAKFEAQVMANYGANRFLPHIYDFFTAGNYAYIVMELVQGRQFEDHLKGKRREQGKAVRITMNILRGLRHLHNHGYLHTDVQPKNILTNDDQPSTVKIIDFGSAVRKEADGTWRGKPKGGTWEYMPAEQFNDVAILDDSSDAYAAAGVCIYLLTGRAPFLPELQNPGGDTVDWDKYRAECYNLHLHALNWNLKDKSLEKVLIKATHPDRKQRYLSDQELINALRPFAHI